MFLYLDFSNIVQWLIWPDPACRPRLHQVWTGVALDGKGAGYALEALGIEVLTTERP